MPRDKQARAGDDVARFAGAEDGPMLPPSCGDLGPNGRGRRKVGRPRDPERWQGVVAEMADAVAFDVPGFWPERDGRAAARQGAPGSTISDQGGSAAGLPKSDPLSTSQAAGPAGQQHEQQHDDQDGRRAEAGGQDDARGEPPSGGSQVPGQVAPTGSRGRMAVEKEVTPSGACTENDAGVPICVTAWIAPDEDNFDPLVPGQVLPAEMYPDDESARLDAERRLARPAWCRDKAMSRAQRTVLRCVAAGATIGEAAREAGVSYNVISHWRRNDASFQSYWDMAQDMSVEILVDTLVFCARRASVNPKYLPSLFKLLAARKPEMWGEKLDVTVTSGPMADNRQLAMMREMLAQMKAKELIGGDAAPQLEEGLPE